MSLSGPLAREKQQALSKPKRHTNSYGIFLPPGASKALVERLHAAVDATVRSPDILRKFVDLGADPQFGSPAEFAAYVADDFAKWARLAKEAGLKTE